MQANVRERVIEARLRKGLQEKKHECVKIYARIGWPDRVVPLPNGEVHWIELKKPKGGVLSPMQKRIHKRLRDKGHKVFVLYTKEDVDNYLSTV